jgi:hypothetical protein
MNEKEVSEIRRRFRPDKSNITHITGCYVNEKGEMVSRFDESLAMMPQEETENFLGVLKRTLSGTLGKNLVDLSFTTQQVVNSEEHKLFMRLRESKLQDPEALETFFRLVTENLHMEGTYLILLAYDTYDVPFRTKDGNKLEDGSNEVYSYFLCSICPVKTTKPALSYHVPDNSFKNLETDWLVSSPELGFLFPTFDDRSTNIYDVLYYTRNTEDNHPELIENLFKTPVPMAAETQKETFHSILTESLTADCSMDIVQNVHDKFRQIIEEHKESKVPEPLTISKTAAASLLASCGATQEQTQVFEQRYDEEFGSDTALTPKNLVDTRKFLVNTPNVTIQVKPEFSELVETRIIDGVKYILIRANDGVEVNGIPVNIQE